MELLPFVDILKVFNNPINEEQAWAVCYQCANFLTRDSPQQQEFYQDIYDSGIHSIWLSRHGDVFIRKGPPEPNGSGKGPPNTQYGLQTTSSSHRLHSPTSSQGYRKRRGHVIATETDAVQALGTSIFEALDYGIDPTEERQLSHELESLITAMTGADNSMEVDDHELQNADDEGIEKDADLEHKCTVHDVLQICNRHLSSKQDAQHHYKAVCRALATEAGELFTFLEKISTHKEKLSETLDEDSKRLDELQRADWACLWVQVTRSLRQGVRLKKVEHVNLPPLEYELTPFEMLLEDIRSRRYTLNKISQADNGQLPHKVKNDAHAYILEFIRSRPPLKKVDERKLKPKPQSPPDPRELLMKEIRGKPKLRPVREGKLLVEKPKLGVSDEPEAPPPTKRVIKADLSLLLNNEESSEDEDCTSNHSNQTSPLLLANTMTPPISWQRAVMKETLLNGTSATRPTRLQRRHTIMVCDSSMDGKVQSQELPPLTEEEEPSPVRENPLSHQFSPVGGGTKLLPRTSFSEHDLSNQILLRNPHLRSRTAPDHRRSLTSLPTELTSIPEMDDVFGGTESPPKHGAIRRSWSHEQAPPPNPSPPCKGRVRSSALALPKNKTGGRNVQQASNTNKRLGPSSGPQSASMSEIMCMYTSKPRASSSLHASHRPQSVAPSNSSMHAPDRSLDKSRVSSLDLDVSLQSPGYFKSPLSISTPSLETVSPYEPSDPAQDASRLRKATSSRTLSERSHLNRDNNPMSNTNSPKRKIMVSSNQRQINSVTTTFGTDDEELYSSKDSNSGSLSSKSDNLIARRPSLDGGVNLYSGAAPGLTLKDKHNIRYSFIEKKESRLKPFNSPEEEERVTRWRTLQDEEMSHRQKKPLEGQPSSPSPSQALVDLEQTPRRPADKLRNVGGSDVLQQKLQKEEARLARWRHLEEAGIAGVKKEVNLKTAVEGPSSSPVHSSPSVPVTTTQELKQTFLTRVTPLPKHWQNPVECLSLTLEEVTHIREVLTKAELESLISHPDLYQQVSKSKICFTCKTTKFSLFGEWGAKCKLCKRTVCSKCLRKMNIPTDHFKNIPVYTLSPAPLTTETHEFIQKFIKSAPPVSVPPTRDSSPSRKRIIPDSYSDLEEEASDTSANLGPVVKPVQRSHSVNITSGLKSAQRSLLKGPLMAICCDCKGMVMEIIRASRASLAMLSSTSGSPASGTPQAPSKLARDEKDSGKVIVR